MKLKPFLSIPPRKGCELVDGTAPPTNKCIFVEMQTKAPQQWIAPCWVTLACLALVSACQSTRSAGSDGELLSAELQAKVEHLSDEPALIDDHPTGARAPEQFAPAPPPAPARMAEPALLKAAGAPRAASLTQAEAHSFIRLKTSIERANAAAGKKKGRAQ